MIARGGFEAAVLKSISYGLVWQGFILLCIGFVAVIELIYQPKILRRGE